MQAEPHPDLTTDLVAEELSRPGIENTRESRHERSTEAPVEAEPVPEELVAEVEVVDRLPVLSGGDATDPDRERGLVRSPAAVPAVQTVAAAATGFVVGAATLALLRRRDARRLTRELRELRGRVDPPHRSPEPPLEPTQSYLVHVRVFGRPPVDPRDR